MKREILKSRCFDILAKTKDPTARIMNYLISQTDSHDTIIKSNEQLYKGYQTKYHLIMNTALQKSIDNVLLLMIRHHIITDKADNDNSGQLQQATTKSAHRPKIKYFNVDPKQQALHIVKGLNTDNPDIKTAIYNISLKDPQSSIFIVKAINTDFKQGLSLLKAYRIGPSNFASAKQGYRINIKKVHALHERIKNTNPNQVAHSEFDEIADFMNDWGYSAALQTYYAFTKTNNPQHYQQLAPVINKKLTALCQRLHNKEPSKSTNY